MKERRRKRLQEMLAAEPFLKDAELALRLQVSVATIRLDRAALGIPELRVRLRTAVAAADEDSRPAFSHGEILELRPQRSAMSLVMTTPAMTDATGYVPAQVLYGIAQSLATKVLGTAKLFCTVGNVKYKAPVRSGERLLVMLSVMRTRGAETYFLMKCLRDCTEVFRTKCIIKSYEEVQA